jgi:hypothetical protein
MAENRNLGLRRRAFRPAFCRMLRSARTLAVGFGAWILADGASAQGLRVELDVPAQPLDQALKAFGAATGSQIFYETALTAGRTSKKVQGVFEREAALQMLLRKSELVARTIAPDTFTIVPTDPLSPALREAKHASVFYYGMIQTGIMAALCRHRETMPGSYRATMQYWIDGAGRIAQVRLIGTTGEKDRDDAIKRAVLDVVFQPAIGAIPQPVTLAIELAAPGQSAGCRPDSGLRAQGQ